MANTRSALKRVRQTKVRQQRNQAMKTKIKTAKNAANKALASGDQEEVKKATAQLFSAADRAVKNGLVHKNFSSRIKSRFERKANAKG